MRFLAAVFVSALLFCQVTPSCADNRVALVIGNSNYQNVSRLPNPINDAGDVAESLKRLGFEVRVLLNAKYDDMRRALMEFGQKAAGADFSLIFFAGHGMQIAGENWLIPVDAALAADLNVPYEAIGLQSAMQVVSNSRKLGLVILDACRNNPFVPKMRMTNVARDVQRGFSRVEPAGNVLVAYAAQDGTTAADGNGRNSPFTGALLKNLETPGLEVRFLFARVHDDVTQATGNAQRPYVYGELSSQQIFLKEATNAPASPAPASDAPPPPACGSYSAHVESTSQVHTTPTVTVNVAYLDAQPGCTIQKVDYKILKQSNFSEMKVAYEDNRKKAKVTYNLADRPTPGFVSIDFVISQTSSK